MAEESCPTCGAPYESGGTFCINCGAKRGGRVEAEAPDARAAGAPAERPEKAEAPPPKDLADVGAPPPSRPSPDEDILERLDDEMAIPTLEKPRKKRGKGCLVGGAVGLVIILAAACVLGFYFKGILTTEGYSHDFATLSAGDFAVWQTGKNALVKSENGMLKIRDALVGANYNPGTNYSVSCTVFAQKAENDLGWAGLVLRVNPKGGDRYAFEILPKKKLAQIVKIAGKTKPLVLASSCVPALRVGTPFTIRASASGANLMMEINGTVVARATDIGLLEGPAGFEARGATAYFDDLNIKPE
jgi:uncharacterized Zn finger protein (UPF0148 family)